MRTIDYLTKLVFPAACPVCGKVQEQRITGEQRRICRACEKKVRRVVQPFCMKCGKPLGKGGVRREYCADCVRQKHFFVQGRAVFLYGSVAQGMYRMKYGNRRDFAVTFAREAHMVLGDCSRRPWFRCLFIRRAGESGATIRRSFWRGSFQGLRASVWRSW